MSNINCPQCGAPLTAGVTECKYCGEVINVPQPVQQAAESLQKPQQPMYTQQPTVQQQGNAFSPALNDGINPTWPIKSKVVAGLLAIFLGSFGIHKFYLGKVGMGILYLIFCWTYIPAIIGFIEGIIYLASNDHNFQVKNQVRIQ